METTTTNSNTRTEKQREASRANGALSHGPVTPEGKAASSRNSLRHGLRAESLVLGNEAPEILESLLQEYTQEFQPETPSEEALITEMAYAKWRQYRTWFAEAGSLNKHMAETRQSLDDTYDHFDESIRTAVAFESSLDRSRALDLYNRAEARCNRQYHRALAAFLAIKKAKSDRANLSPSPC